MDNTTKDGLLGAAFFGALMLIKLLLAFIGVYVIGEIFEAVTGHSMFTPTMLAIVLVALPVLFFARYADGRPVPDMDPDALRHTFLLRHDDAATIAVLHQRMGEWWTGLMANAGKLAVMFGHLLLGMTLAFFLARLFMRGTVTEMMILADFQGWVILFGALQAFLLLPLVFVGYALLNIAMGYVEVYGAALLLKYAPAGETAPATAAAEVPKSEGESKPAA